MILIAVFIENPPFLREALMFLAAAGSWFTTKKQIHEANHFNFHPIREVAVLFIGIFATMMPALDYLQLHAGRLGQAGPGFFFWGSGVLSSALDNAPTYLSFLEAIFGAFVDHAAIQQVQALVANHGDGLAAASESVRHTYEALQKYHGALLANNAVDTDHIKVAFLVGNAKFNAYLVAISVASVFFGACTYIGNGPNFMVKSIADHQKVHTPGFIGYLVRFTLPFMLPMLVLVWWLFFRR
jgi:Na+/H+ antiporter NhaD/arsenite permease-like protein